MGFRERSPLMRTVLHLRPQRITVHLPCENAGMPCDRYQELEYEARSARERANQFTRANDHLWGRVSAAEAKGIEKAERQRYSELTNEKYRHRSSCEVCKAEEARFEG